MKITEPYIDMEALLNTDLSDSTLDSDTWMDICDISDADTFGEFFEYFNEHFSDMREYSTPREVLKMLNERTNKILLGAENSAKEIRDLFVNGILPGWCEKSVKELSVCPLDIPVYAINFPDDIRLFLSYSDHKTLYDFIYRPFYDGSFVKIDNDKLKSYRDQYHEIFRNVDKSYIEPVYEDEWGIHVVDEKTEFIPQSECNHTEVSKFKGICSSFVKTPEGFTCRKCGKFFKTWEEVIMNQERKKSEEAHSKLDDLYDALHKKYPADIDYTSNEDLTEESAVETIKEVVDYENKPELKEIPEEEFTEIVKEVVEEIKEPFDPLKVREIGHYKVNRLAYHISENDAVYVCSEMNISDSFILMKKSELEKLYENYNYKNLRVKRSRRYITNAVDSRAKARSEGKDTRVHNG
jgi:hypothetical protein